MIQWFKKVNQEFGRKPLKANSKRNLTENNTSIQGQWTNTMWNQYPKHLMENSYTVPKQEVQLLPRKLNLERKVFPHPTTKRIRSKPAFDDNQLDPS